MLQPGAQAHPDVQGGLSGVKGHVQPGAPQQENSGTAAFGWQRTMLERVQRLSPMVAVITILSTEAHALSPAEMRDRTAFIAERYLQIWSSNDALPVEGVPYMYGPSVMFYGRRYTQAQLMAEKRRAIQQWPVRRYVHRPGTLRVICNAATQKCAARSTIDFEASNPRRGTYKSGSAKFDLGVSFAERHPRILYESGSLNSRRSDENS